MGNGISHMVSRNDVRTSCQEKSPSGVRIARFFQILKPDSMMSIRKPGSRPARNRFSIGTSATTPYKINGRDGAKSKPRLPAEVTSPRLNFSG